MKISKRTSSMSSLVDNQISSYAGLSQDCSIIRSSSNPSLVSWVEVKFVLFVWSE